MVATATVRPPSFLSRRLTAYDLAQEPNPVLTLVNPGFKEAGRLLPTTGSVVFMTIPPSGEGCGLSLPPGVAVDANPALIASPSSDANSSLMMRSPSGPSSRDSMKVLRQGLIRVIGNPPVFMMLSVLPQVDLQSVAKVFQNPRLECFRI